MSSSSKGGTSNGFNTRFPKTFPVSVECFIKSPVAVLTGMGPLELWLLCDLSFFGFELLVDCGSLSAPSDAAQQLFNN